MGRRTLLLIASILVAALGTSLVWLYVQGADTRAQQESALVDVLFLDQKADAGTVATSLKTVVKQVPEDVASGAVRPHTNLTGQLLGTPAVAGQILLTSMLGTEQAKRFPQGGAVALSIGEPNRVPADLKAGDVVDVFALGQGQQPTEVVLTCVTVRSVGPPPASRTGTTSAAGSPAVPLTIVTFDVNQADAQKLYSIAGQQPALYDHDRTQPC